MWCGDFYFIDIVLTHYDNVDNFFMLMVTEYATGHTRLYESEIEYTLLSDVNFVQTYISISIK